MLHAKYLVGITGSYGRRLRAAVIVLGATARGGVIALNAHGVGEVRALATREVAAVSSPIPGTHPAILDIEHCSPSFPHVLLERRLRREPAVT